MADTYDATFFDYIDDGAVSSASVVIPAILEKVELASVLDVGCGQGAWLGVWEKSGISDYAGLDGAYVDTDKMACDPEKFRAHDLATPFALNRKFDVACSFEVGEHLSPEVSELFIKSICDHADVVIFSAAVLGQGGNDHINEKPLEDWRKIFGKLGFQAYDALRPEIKSEKKVRPWYRYNSLIYANEAGAKRLSRAALSTQVPPNVVVSEGGDLTWRLRRFVVRKLPLKTVTHIAQLQASIKVKLNRVKS